MNDDVKKELFDLLGRIKPEAVAGLLRRVEAGLIEGEVYVIMPGEHQFYGSRGAFESREPCGCIKGSAALEDHDFGLNDNVGERSFQHIVETYLKEVLHVRLSLNNSKLEQYVIDIHYGDTPQDNPRSEALRAAIVEFQNRSEFVKGE